MSSSDLDRLKRYHSDALTVSWFGRIVIGVVTLTRLEVVSAVHSCIYVGLLICAIALHNPQPVTTVLGFTHGVVWIGMSLVCITAARYRVIPWWLAVGVAVLGGIGPFFGTVGFVLESRRRHREPTGNSRGVA